MIEQDGEEGTKMKIPTESVDDSTTLTQSEHQKFKEL